MSWAVQEALDALRLQPRWSTAL